MTVVAEVVRNGFVEGTHHGSAVIVDAAGEVRFQVGDPAATMLPRSCAKPLQALGMLGSGLDVDDELLAIICASHSGEPEHLETVRRVLAQAGLTTDDLDNTPAMPMDAGRRRELTREGVGPASLTQNCSGKHAGMLATCVAAGWPTAGYRDFGHPLQVALRDTMAALTGDSVDATTVDGCGAPCFSSSLAGLARAFTRLGRAGAAMSAYPFLVGGTGRDVTAIMTALPGSVAKDGAEGVYAVTLPSGLAAAVKIDDGAERARLPVLIAALRAAGAAKELSAIDDYATTPVKGHGDRVGEVRAVLE